MLDTVITFLWHSDMGGHTFVGDEMKKEAAQSFIDLIYETADGFLSVAVMRHKEWVGLSKAVDCPEWLEDPRFQDTAGLEVHKNARLELTQSALKKRGTAEWIRILEGHDVPCAPVLTRREVIRHAQVEANKILIEIDHPQAGKLRQTRNAAQFEGTPTEQRMGAPWHGEHGREVLAELGYAESAIADMIEAGIVVETPANSEAEA